MFRKKRDTKQQRHDFFASGGRWNVSELFFSLFRLFVCLFEESLGRDESSRRRGASGESRRRRNEKKRTKPTENRSQSYRVASNSPMASEGHEFGMNFYRCSEAGDGGGVERGEVCGWEGWVGAARLLKGLEDPGQHERGRDSSHLIGTKKDAEGEGMASGERLQHDPMFSAKLSECALCSAQPLEQTLLVRVPHKTGDSNNNHYHRSNNNNIFFPNAQTSTGPLHL